MMDIPKEMAARLYKDFESHMDQVLFEYMTERTDIMERAERAVCAVKGIEWEAYLNSNGELYDDVWHDATNIAHDTMSELQSRYRE